MDTKTLILVLVSVYVNGVRCVYESQPLQKEDLYREPLYKQPAARILMHKQAQSHDGGFKFAYSAENGLAQTEVISPDGSRNGGYSYVDPHGKTITVKYTAGKEGFRIIQGDHVPKETPNVPNQQQPTQYQTQDDGQYKPEKYEYSQFPQPVYPKPKYQYYEKPSYQTKQQYYITKPVPVSQPQPRLYAPQTQQPQSYPQHRQETSASNSVEDTKEPEYNDEPGKPYSFGVGYSFQFSS